MPHIATFQRLRGFLPRHASWVVALLYLLSVLIRQYLSKNIPIPTIYPDEWLYIEMARSLGEGRLLFWGSHFTNFPCWLYPGLIAPPIALLEFDGAIEAIRWLNAILISATAPIAYALAREVTTKTRALVAASLTALLPALAYSGTLMTENAYFPAFLLAMWFMFRAIERPTFGRRLLGGLVMAIPIHVKPQGLTVPIIFAATVILYHGEELARSRDLKRSLRAVSVHWLTAIGFMIGYLPRLIEVMVFEHPGAPFKPQFLMGYYQQMGFHQAAFNTALFSKAFLANAVGWAIACGVLPAWALIRAIPQLRRLSPTLRLFLIQAAVAALGQALLNARHIMLSHEPANMYERYYVAVVPMALIAFAAVHGKLTPSRAGLRTGLAFLILALITIGLTQVPNRWHLTSDTPTLSGVYYIFTEPGTKAYVSLAWYGLVVFSICMLFNTRGRYAFTIAAVALFLVACNFGHYLTERKVIGFEVRKNQQVARQIQKHIKPGEKLIIWGDGLADSQLFQIGFRNRGRVIAQNHWYADRPKVDHAGRFESPFPAEKTWLAASDTVQFNQQPIMRKNGIALYRMQGLTLSK